MQTGFDLYTLYTLFIHCLYIIYSLFIHSLRTLFTLFYALFFFLTLALLFQRPSFCISCKHFYICFFHRLCTLLFKHIWSLSNCCFVFSWHQLHTNLTSGVFGGLSNRYFISKLPDPWPKPKFSHIDLTTCTSVLTSLRLWNWNKKTRLFSNCRI